MQASPSKKSGALPPPDPTLSLAPLASLRVTRHLIPASGLLPNCSVSRKPLLHYHAAFFSSFLSPLPSSPSSAPADAAASAIETHLRTVGVVEPSWRYTMYSATHFHSTAHEVLCVGHGRARLCFGGENNPGRVVVEAALGDVLVVPAGVAHRLLEDLTSQGDGKDKEDEDDAATGFEMVGSYPKGCDWDMCYGKEGEEIGIENIKKLRWFDRDPIYGDVGPALEA